MSTLISRRSSPDRACESLFRRHADDVYRYSLALLHGQSDAEDATQTTFLNAYRALERGERPRDARKWLCAIALNVCREHHRRSARRPDEVSLEHDSGELVLDPPTYELDDLLRGLSALPFNQRAALVMRELEGRPLKEIAGELGVSVSAVETLLFRARRALREQLEGALSCAEAEQAISRQLDGALPRAERGPLRAHLRECPECAALARRVRAQRGAMRKLAVALPVPVSLELHKLLGGGAVPAQAVAASASTPFLAGLGAKLAALTVAGAAVAGAGLAVRAAEHNNAHRHAMSRVAIRPGASRGARATRALSVTPNAIRARTRTESGAIASRRSQSGHAAAGGATGYGHAYGSSRAGKGNSSANEGKSAATHGKSIAPHSSSKTSHAGHAYGTTKPKPNAPQTTGTSGSRGKK